MDKDWGPRNKRSNRQGCSTVLVFCGPPPFLAFLTPRNPENSRTLSGKLLEEENLCRLRRPALPCSALPCPLQCEMPGQVVPSRPTQPSPARTHRTNQIQPEPANKPSTGRTQKIHNLKRNPKPDKVEMWMVRGAGDR